MIKYIIKCFLCSFLFFQFSFASNLNQITLDNAIISIIEDCINSNNTKTKCKNPKFIKENLIKKGYKFDNKTLKNSINLAINSLENKNKFNSNLTKSNEITLSFKQNTQIDDDNKTSSLNSDNKANLPNLNDKTNFPHNKTNSKNKISISFSLDENLAQNDTVNSLNLDDIAENNSNYQTIQIKDKNLSNDTTFLIGSNSINSFENNQDQDNVLLNLLNKNTQIYTQRHDFGPGVLLLAVPPYIGAVLAQYTTRLMINKIGKFIVKNGLIKFGSSYYSTALAIADDIELEVVEIPEPATHDKELINRIGELRIYEMHQVSPPSNVNNNIENGNSGNSGINGSDNKLNHIFGKKEHNLDKFLKSFNDNQYKAYDSVIKKLEKDLVNKKLPNSFITGYNVNVNGFKITVRGVVVNGKPQIGTMFISR